MNSDEVRGDAIATVCAKVSVATTATGAFLGLGVLWGGAVHFLFFKLFQSCVVLAAATALIVIVIRVNGLGKRK